MLQGSLREIETFTGTTKYIRVYFFSFYRFSTKNVYHSREDILEDTMHTELCFDSKNLLQLHGTEYNAATGQAFVLFRFIMRRDHISGARVRMRLARVNK